MNFEIINLPKIVDGRGNLSIIEEFKHIPFKIKRTYWIYDVPGGVERGGHAYKQNIEFVVALSGSFDVEINLECILTFIIELIILWNIYSNISIC